MSMLFEEASTCVLQRPLRQKLPVQGPKRKVIVISGPTGVGKTRLSLRLAGVLGGEIVLADSMQVYKGMDIGTAKPSKEELRSIPHHLIDLLSLDEEFSVFDFYTEASRVLKDIAFRDKVPIVVGGTGFYVHALLYGPPTTPPSIPAIRSRLEEEMQQKGAEALYAELQRLDPLYARTITQNDRHKIIRALEIIALTKNPVSHFVKEPLLDSPQYDFRCWFLALSLQDLYAKIEKRCDRMIEEGFIDELRRLDKEGLREHLSASKAIGYRQGLAFLDSAQTEADFQHFMTEFKKTSRRYAKRQLTWFRRESDFRWLDVGTLSEERIMDIIIQDFDTPQ